MVSRTLKVTERTFLDVAMKKIIEFLVSDILSH